MSIGISLIDNNSIKLQWYYEGEEIDKFNIYKSIEAGVNYVNLYKETTEKYYIDSAVNDGETYFYKVSAVDKAGNNGELSAEVHIKVPSSTSPSEATTKKDEENIKTTSESESGTKNITENILNKTLKDVLDLAQKKHELKINTKLNEIKSLKIDIESAPEHLGNIKKIKQN